MDCVDVFEVFESGFTRRRYQSDSPLPRVFTVTLINRFLGLLQRLRSLGAEPENTRIRLEQLLVFQSAIEEYRRRHSPPPSELQHLEYKVFSQFGDDGIIAYLSQFIPAEFRCFVEFGVEDYRESNTRLLLLRDNWKGLVLDGSSENIQRIKNEPYFWRHDLSAIATFVTAENIDNLLADAGYSGTIGLLSVDIDGVDYWVLKAIERTHPLILICEYNSIWGREASVTVPYDPAFSRIKKHPSGLYAGASLRSFAELAAERGLRLLGCNSAGNNAYFVHESLDIPLETKSVSQAFVASRFREGRDKAGKLFMRTCNELIGEIADMPVVDLANGKTIRVKEIANETV